MGAIVLACWLAAAGEPIMPIGRTLFRFRRKRRDSSAL